MESPAEFKVAPGVDGPALALSGYWTAEQMGPAARGLSRALREEGKPSFDLTQVGRLDTAGAYAILRAAGERFDLARVKARPEMLRLLELVKNAAQTKPVPRPQPTGFTELTIRIGKGVVDVAAEGLDTMVFLGHLLVVLGRTAVNLVVRPKRIRWPALVALIERAGLDAIPIVAVDLPSGLPGDHALPLGYAPRAVLTVTFHRKKPAHVLEPGRALCGEAEVVDIGLGDPIGCRLHENGPELWADRFPWPDVEAHKHARGSLLVVSGHVHSTGAARLAARAGLRIGAGLSTVMSPPDALMVNAMALEAVMVRPFRDPQSLAEAASRAQAVVIGPAAGVDTATEANVEALAGTEAALVLDADALTVFQDRPERLFRLLNERDLLTPHPGEFKRIFPGVLEGARERITAARQAAERAGAVVLLKGTDTVIAHPDGRAVVNTNGSPFLATAGSGDVLAGFIGGLVAQGMEAFDAACAGAWVHAEAGAGFGAGLISEDLPELAPAVLDALRS